MAPEQLGFDTAAPFVPDRPTLPRLRAAAAGCTACHLYTLGTQTVFVGEQPGAQEDLAGRPFVGPAGRVLDEGLAAAGIDRSQVYVTNAVKHFKWEPRDKRRIHQKPNWAEMTACRPWLEGRARGGPAGRPRLPRGHGSAVPAGAPVPRHQDARRARGVGVRPERRGDRASVLHPPGADEGARHEAMRLHPRPESSREADQVALSASRSSAGSVTGARQAKFSQT